MGIPMAMCSQVPMLSPVQTAPNLCDPAKNALDKTNGLCGGLVLCTSACAVALCLRRKYERVLREMLDKTYE